ncbi:MAG: flavin-containing monooxygenase [Acidimicrobiales bacterium]
MSRTARVRQVEHTAIIVGAGFSGLGTAIRLRHAGITDFVILERSDRVGGTWRDNTYPGAACDVPSLLYSLSFARNPEWSEAFSRAEEIQAYVEGLVERFDLAAHLRFDQEVSGLAFDEPTGTWTATTARGDDHTARAVVAAPGPLANASLPAMRGIDRYRGHKIHSARWDHSYDMAGKRVAVIGTGASAVQIIPELVGTAERVKVFQRTPGWVMPRPNVRVPAVAKRLFRTVPVTQDAARAGLFWTMETAALGLVWDTPITTALAAAGRAHLRAAVKDPWMRRQLTPDFRPGCKRTLTSSSYYRALQEPNCELVTWPIATLSPDGVRTSDGIEHAVDCIVFATGFEVSHRAGFPFPVIGVDRRSLAKAWSPVPQAYKSVNIGGFPNLFLTFGPNSGPGHNSALVYVEAQIDYAVRAIKAIVDKDLRIYDVRPDAQERFNRDIQRRLKRTTWNSGCQSWYLTEDGFNAAMYPGFATQFRRQMRRFHRTDYVLEPREQAAGVDAGGKRRRVPVGSA